MPISYINNFLLKKFSSGGWGRLQLRHCSSPLGLGDERESTDREESSGSGSGIRRERYRRQHDETRTWVALPPLRHRYHKASEPPTYRFCAPPFSYSSLGAGDAIVRLGRNGQPHSALDRPAATVRRDRGSAYTRRAAPRIRRTAAIIIITQRYRRTLLQ